MRDEKARRDLDDHGLRTQTCGAGEEALAISLISPKSGPGQALLRSRHQPHPCQSLLLVRITDVRSLTHHMHTNKALSCSEITTRCRCAKKKRSQDSVPGSWFVA